MIDAAVPFRKALGEAFTGDNAAAAILEAAKVARAAADSTADITASLGRSRVLGEKSLGTPDPGAISFSILMTELGHEEDRKSTRLNSSHVAISYAVFCLKKKKHHTSRTLFQIII